MIKFDEKTFMYIDEEGVSYETKEGYIQCGIFDFCGCGDTERNLRYIKKQLEKVENRQIEDTEEFYFFLYWADSKELLEHGCSIGSSWLTDKGKETLKDINEVLK